MSEPLSIVTYRGIKCISTFPIELVWGKPGTCLECANCVAYASNGYSSNSYDSNEHSSNGVLLGLCTNCAPEYNGKYGSGFHGFLEDMEDMQDNNEYSLNLGYQRNLRIFGDIDPFEIDLNTLPSSEYKQKANISKDAYSVYNLAQTSNSDFNLLVNKYIVPEHENYGWLEFKKEYPFPNDNNDEILGMLIDKIDELRTQFDQWNPEFLERCEKIEKLFKQNINNINITNITDITNINNIADRYQIIPLEPSIQYQCEYCKQYKDRKELKKCSKCKAVRYCSLICQKRDWNCEYEAHRQTCGRASLEVGAEVVEEAIEESSDEVSVGEVSLEEAIENIEIEDVD